MKKKIALTIAGSDSGGGAGIQADIKTMMANGVFATSAITALTAQNTLGVTDILDVPPEFLAKELDAVFTDLRPHAIKIGMVSSPRLMDVIHKKLMEYNGENIVVDTVMVATSGAKLISDEAIDIMKKKLLPIATLTTPNIPEAEILADMSIKNPEDMEKAANIIREKYDCAVLLKGGHNLNDANDFLLEKNNSLWFYGEKIDNPDACVGCGACVGKCPKKCLEL